MRVKNQITKNFTLREFERSAYAKRHGIDNHIPNLAIYNNAFYLIEQVQKLRDIIGKPVIITSGYRCTLLNKRIGGSLASQHQVGEAVDIVIPGMTNNQVIKVIKDNKLPYDQLIEEDKQSKDDDRPKDGWVHWSYKSENRFQLKRIINKR